MATVPKACRHYPKRCLCSLLLFSAAHPMYFLKLGTVIFVSSCISVLTPFIHTKPSSGNVGKAVCDSPWSFHSALQKWHSGEWQDLPVCEMLLLKTEKVCGWAEQCMVDWQLTAFFSSSVSEYYWHYCALKKICSKNRFLLQAYCSHAQCHLSIRSVLPLVRLI